MGTKEKYSPPAFEISSSVDEDQTNIYVQRNLRKVHFLEGTRLLLWRVWQVLGPFFTRGKNVYNKSALFLAFVVSLELLLESGVLVGFSFAQKHFTTALTSKDEPGFYRGVWMYVGILTVAAPVFALGNYLQGLLALRWREWLTVYLCDQYFSNRAFFAIKTFSLPAQLDVTTNPIGRNADNEEENQGGGLDQSGGSIDNPDQRIGEDVSTFCTNCVNLMVAILGKAVNVASFIGVLLVISPQLTIFVVGYSILGTAMTLGAFGKRLKHLTFESAKKEANFRFGLVRVREHAEEIAFYNGGSRELVQTRKLLDQVLQISVLRLMANAQLDMFQNCFSWFTAVLPYLVVAHRYFSGELEFGVISQTAMAFRVIQSGLSVLVNKVQTLSGIAAQTERLHYLLVSLEKINVDGDIMATYEKDCKSPEKEGLLGNGSFYIPSNLYIPREQISYRTPYNSDVCLQVSNLTLLSPDNSELICSNLSFTLRHSENLLIFGPSGCGKSSLLRAICGLWPFGRGEIERLPIENVMFLPQKSYMPLGDLRDQLMYPHKPRICPEQDNQIFSVLKTVRLEHIGNRSGGLSAVHSWSDELSVGEQQRLAFGRLLTQPPKIAFLDEATSALGSSDEELLYTAAQKVDTVVSIGHRSSLFKFHSRVLLCERRGVWKMMTMNDFLKQIDS